jgi:hypothetical protein
LAVVKFKNHWKTFILIIFDRFFTRSIHCIEEYSERHAWKKKKKKQQRNLKAARMVTRATKLTSVNKIYIESGLNTLQKKTTKPYNDTFPQNDIWTYLYLQKFIPPKSNEPHYHNTKDSENLSPIRCRTNLYVRSFFTFYHDSMKKFTH